MGSPIRYIAVATTLLLGVFVAVTEPLKAQNPEPAASKPAIHQATVRHIESTEVREVPSGKASIRLLAEGQEAFVGLLRMDGGGKVPEFLSTHPDSENRIKFLESHMDHAMALYRQAKQARGEKPNP